FTISNLNVNGSNFSIKRHRVAEWIKKYQQQYPTICCLQETHFRYTDTYRLKMKGWKNIFHANGNQKKAGLYTNPKEPEKVTEIYQFKFKYTKEGATMDFDSSNTSFESGTNSEDIKKASVLLIRKLYILTQNLGPLPNDVILTMKLHYYNAVTPHDYQPPGFKEGVNSHFLLFEGEPVNLQVGIVSTGFHSMKVKVTTEATRVSDLENSLFQENNTTEIAHQGLDCDEEEEECNNHIQRMNLVYSQQSSERSRKKRKVSEPVKVFIPDRK
ncbi:HORMA domain-containing protein 2, partial [Pteropus alecto]